MLKNCIVCNKEFRTSQSRIKSGKGKYCSKQCYTISQTGQPITEAAIKNFSTSWRGIKQTKEWIEKRAMTHRGKKRSEETKKKLSLIGFTKTGDKCSHWKGGKRMSNGYLEIFSPLHPFAGKSRYVRNSHLVMEKHIGRYLKPGRHGEIVHHINNIKTDDRIENLMLFPNHSEHAKHHHSLHS